MVQGLDTLTSEEIEKVKIFRYAEKRNLTIQVAAAEPNEYIELAFMLWKMDAQRDNLRSGNNQQ